MEEKNILAEVEDDEISLIDLLVIIFKRKNLILGFTFSIALCTAVISLMLPEIYKGSAKIVPSTASASKTSAILSQLGGLAAGMIGGVSLQESSDFYAQLLKSQAILDKVIDRFDLKKLYNQDTLDGTREALLDNTSFDVDRKSNIITVSVYDKDPVRAAEMANFFVDELIKFTNKLALTEASRKRVFFEQQLKETFKKLQEAESKFASFQAKTGVLKIEDQTKALIQAIANFKAKIVEKEIELKVLKTYLTEDNPRFKKLKEELKGMKEKLKEFERKKQEKFDPFLSAQVIPSEGLEYLRRLRELKFYESLYSIMLKQYEAAKLEEAREKDVIQIIDRATPPEKRAKPKRRLMVMIATVSGFFISLFIAFLLEFFENAKKDPALSEKMELLKKYAGFPGLKIFR